ncbi:hypothetical protein QFC21_001233 [Naganishia friedmannii]|uniref:Uncharacterized protein n=1 Tax=Naganishia friedmannii TaxID=89922 RepID=A0ACC2W3R2_9TREE|nr:hypothetical protein QFC21_001233 [Naganishia friedmannii]
MKLGHIVPWLLAALLASAQSSTILHNSSPASSTATSRPASATDNSTASQLITTILTTITPVSSGAAPITTPFVLTIALNTTLPTAANSSSSTTYANGTTIYSNGTTVYSDGTTITSNGTVISSNGTTIINGTAADVWNGTQAWLPFKVRIDGAYGAGGAVLLLSGGSSMAIVSGYSCLLFTLVLILRFGVEAKLNPPSPQYPGATERGLYCLACIIAAIIGSGIGLFFFKYARYWVCGLGGFALGWFIMAFKAGGVTGNSIVGRWGLIGGLSVVTFIASLLPRWHHHLLLVCTALVGSTALTLGIDCFTRAGLKEFYIWNLGFRDLFPKVQGYKYPLLTIMQVELGVLAAFFLIGTAIQYRVLGKLHVKVQQLQAEERARCDDEEEEKAAARFKGVEDDREKWEGKYGNKKGQMSAMEEGVPLTTLSKDSRPDSTLSLMRRTASGHEGHSSSGAYSPGAHLDGESRGSASLLPQMQLGDSIIAATGIDTDEGASYGTVTAEDAERLRLKREIEDTKRSIEFLRTSTPTSSVPLLERPISSAAPFDSARTRRPSALSYGSRASGYSQLPLTSASPISATGRQNRDWEEYLADRKLFTPPAGVTPPIESSFGRLSKMSDSVLEAIHKRERTMSAHELGAGLAAEEAQVGMVPDPTMPYNRRHSSMEVLALAQPARPAPIATQPRPQSGYRSPPVITGHADSHLLTKSGEGRNLPFDNAQRGSISFEELNARHRNRLSKLQLPVTEEIQSSMQLAEVKARYDKNREAEKRAAAKKAAADSVPGPRKVSQPTGTTDTPHLPLARGPESSVLANIPQESGTTKAARWAQRQSTLGVALERPVAFERPSEQERARGSRRRYSSGPDKIVN